MPRGKLTIVVLSALLLSACVVAPYRPGPGPYGYDSYGPDVAVTTVAPPPPYAEVIPVAPFLGAVWISGYWGWSGGRHHWVGGHYERPRPGYRWMPHRWEPRGGQWHLRGGGWVR
jgi:hypothetical protein